MQLTNRNAFGLSLIAAAALAACGGGSGDSTPAATTLSGVAATGAALAGATITVADSDTTTPDKTATSRPDGGYDVDITNLKPPLLVKVSATFQGAPLVLVAVVPSVTASAANTANVTPLTNAVAALVAPGGDPSSLLAVDTLKTVTAQKLSNAAALVVNTLSTDPTIKAALGAAFDPLTTKFNANGTGIDAVLDKLDVAVSASGVAITNLAAPTDANGVPPAPVTLTAAQADTPATVPTLPNSGSSGDTPTLADIAALGAKFDACFALPLAQRVTLDANGNATKVDSKCDFAPSNWRSSGRSWLQQVGQFTFSKNYYTGTKAGQGQIVLAMAAAGFTDAKTFKHPYCNDKPCAIVRYPLTTPSGQTVQTDWMLGKTDSGWNFVGNQLPYNTFVEARLIKIQSQNPAASANSLTNPYFFQSRFESRLRLLFDLGVGSTNNIRAVRITGPGLPSAGVTLVRSQVCGMSDRMAITYQDGATRNSGNNFVFWTGSSASDFKLDAANLDGSALIMPTPVKNSTAVSFQDYASAPVANQSTVARAWSVYKVEVFHYDVPSDTADEVLYVRTNSPAENAAAGATKSWPSLTQSLIDDYLKPTGAKAGAVADLARTLSWTFPVGGYVGSGWLYSSNFSSATNAQNETATYGLRNRIDFEPAALGDSTASGYQFADTRSGTELSSYTETIGTNPNPRCSAAPGVTALTTSTADYREIGLSFRSPDRKLYQSIWYWQN